MASQIPNLKSSLSLPLFLSFLLFQLPSIHARGVTYNDSGITAADLNSPALIQVKTWCAIILLISTFAGAIFPYFFRRNETFLVVGTQFAGGVFLATALVQFLNDSAAIYYELSGNNFPIMFLFGLMGYLVAMFGDCLVIKYVKKGEIELRLGGVSDPENGKEGGIVSNSGVIRTAPIGDTVLLLVALCFHAVFEAISVGVSGRERYAWTSLWTTLVHQIPAAIAMTITLLKMLPKRPFLLTLSYSIAYAISSPIGVGIGVGIGMQGRSADWTYAIAMSIASGILIFVAINHLIAKGFRPQRKLKFDSPFYKFLAFFVGVVVMSILLIFSD